MKVSRRNFLKQSSVVLGSTALLSTINLGCNKKNGTTDKSFGFQAWTIRTEINEDLAGTCKKMAGLGYKEIEMCSPLGYSDAGFGPLNKYSGTELRRIIEDNGLTCTSSHYNLGELRNSLDNRIEWAHQLGMKQMILSSFWLPKEKQTIANYRKAAAELNIIAEKTKAAGLQMGFHNHDMEFEKRGNELIYNALLDEFDSELVKMQFQVSVVHLGYHAADFFRKHPGRFISAHLQDWSKEMNKQVPIGQGDVNWIDFFKAAKIGGVKNVFVEQAPEMFKEDLEFLARI